MDFKQIIEAEVQKIAPCHKIKVSEINQDNEITVVATPKDTPFNLFKELFYMLKANGRMNGFLGRLGIECSVTSLDDYSSLWFDFETFEDCIDFMPDSPLVKFTIKLPSYEKVFSLAYDYYKF